jgi:soluble lytic murein transglycosylase-like protein
MQVTRRQLDEIREICACQQHARERHRRTLWRRSLRLLVGVPLVFGAVGVPMDAMNAVIPALQHRVTAPSFQIFTTKRVREQFLAGGQSAPQSFTLEVAKEEFFRTHVPYGPIIYREAKRNNLSPELVAAVVEAESDFRPKLVSNKNALGLMQIIPETGRLMGADNLFNPTENIAAGTRYLRYLFDRFGDERTVLAAYNAGEGNVERFGGIPPFQETLSYLQRVTFRTKQYESRIRGDYLTSLRLRNAVVE